MNADAVRPSRFVFCKSAAHCLPDFVHNIYLCQDSLLAGACFARQWTLCSGAAAPKCIEGKDDNGLPAHVNNYSDVSIRIADSPKTAPRYQCHQVLPGKAGYMRSLPCRGPFCRGAGRSRSGSANVWSSCGCDDDLQCTHCTHSWLKPCCKDAISAGAP